MGRDDKIKALRKLTPLELEKRLNDSRTELANLKFERASRDLENPVRLRELRRVIARCLTLMREAEINAAPGGRSR
jgi:large subunit ribosomal protein L29